MLAAPGARLPLGAARDAVGGLELEPSNMPIGPTRLVLRNWRTTDSSEESSISRGPNIARCLWSGGRPLAQEQ